MVETPKGNLSKGMRQLNGVYIQRLNRRHGGVGHVFQGRFKAILVDKKNRRGGGRVEWGQAWHIALFIYATYQA